MQAVKSSRYVSPQEYLMDEGVADSKHEYLDGEVRAMSGAHFNHTLVASRVFGQMYKLLEGGACSPLNPDLRVHIPATRSYLYPDVTVLCGDPLFADEAQTTILNPTLIVEVLSPSTEQYDRAQKFFLYQSIDSLRDYVLISQREPLVEHFFRQGEDESSRQWQYVLCRGIDTVLRLPSLKIQIALEKIYSGMKFPSVGESTKAGGFNNDEPPA